VMVDLAGCSSTEPPYVMVSQCNRETAFRGSPKGVFEAGRIEMADNCASWFEGPND